MSTPTSSTLLLRLTLELRWKIYAIIRGPRQLIDITDTRFELNTWLKTQIYRPSSEKRCICILRNRDRYIRGGKGYIDTESRVTFSDSYIAQHRRTCSKRYEWRTGLLTVCKDVSADVLDYLYGHNTFLTNIHDNGHLNFTKFSVENLQRIRHVCIVARYKGKSYGHNRPLILDDHLWQPLLNGLSQFCIVVQQPLSSQTYRNAQRSEKKMHEWTNWLDPVLRYFSANISLSTAIKLDDNGCTETTALMEKHFAGRYTQIETITADKCFKRGRYSYWASDGSGT